MDGYRGTCKTCATRRHTVDKCGAWDCVKPPTASAVAGPHRCPRRGWHPRLCRAAFMLTSRAAPATTAPMLRLSHVPAPEARAVGLSLGVGAALMAVKFVAYFLTGSAVIFADAMESIV